MDQSASLQSWPKSNSLATEWWADTVALTECRAQISGFTPAVVSICFIHCASVRAVTELCGLVYDTKKVTASPRILDTCKDISEKYEKFKISTLYLGEVSFQREDRTKFLIFKKSWDMEESPYQSLPRLFFQRQKVNHGTVPCLLQGGCQPGHAAYPRNWWVNFEEKSLEGEQL